MKKLSPERETSIRADSVLHQNDAGHQDAAPTLHLSKREKNSHQGKIQLRPLKGLHSSLRESSQELCFLLQQIAESLGWAQPGIPGVEYPHLATWDAGVWGGVCFLQLPGINVITEVGSQLERMEPDLPKRQTAK